MPSTEYEFYVKAINSVTESPASKIIVKTDEAKISMPSNLKCLEKTMTSVSLQWDSIEGATEYEIYYGGKIAKSLTNSIVIGGLSMDTIYSFTVRAKNEYVTSQESLPLVVRTYPLPLPEVTGLKCIGKSSTSAELTWNSISGAISYEVKYGENSVIVNENSVILTNLIPKTQYAFTVRALSDDNIGNWGKSLIITTLKEGAGAYNEVLANVQKDSVYNLVFAGDNLVNISEKTFVIRYDEEMLELIDFAAQTPDVNKTVGNVPDTDLQITLIGNGTIEFKINKSLPEDKSWSGMLTIIKFKALKTRSTDIYFEQ